MVSSDPQLKNAGQQRGMEIWRINNFALEKLPPELFGMFYTGDSYIILYTKNPGEWNVHFWLGKETSVVQEHESSLFLSYFKQGIRYISGGAPSGFTHVVDQYENWQPKLFQCKGKRNVRCIEVSCKRESLNLGDVFILDCGLKIYVWMPPQSGRLERIKGTEQARNIRDRERTGKPDISILDSDWNSNDEFWKILGGKGEVKPAEAGGSDENYWQPVTQQLTLWKVSDESGEMEIKMISQGNFKHSQLDSKDAFVLDAQNGGIFVWIGKKCTIDERKKAMNYATQYLKLQNRSENTQLIRVLEGAEPASFTQWANMWETNKKAAPFIPKLYQCSNQSGRLAIEEITDYTQQDLVGDDVMIVDALDKIYVWLGSGANEQEKLFADSVANKYLQGDVLPRPDGARIIRIEQGKETAEFKKIFGKWDDHISVSHIS